MVTRNTKGQVATPDNSHFTRVQAVVLIGVYMAAGSGNGGVNPLMGSMKDDYITAMRSLGVTDEELMEGAEWALDVVGDVEEEDDN